jgi:methionine-S-sulfoxide reductase
MSEQKLATFAGGCFWCMQPAFNITSGVLSTSVGYAGGKETHPTYEEVCAGRTGHVEAIQIAYDPDIVEYTTLLKIFWENIDPTDPQGQFADKGKQYLSAIFFHDEKQKEQAIQSKQALLQGQTFKNIATQIIPFTTFYPAEDYHQEYYKKRPIQYQLYHHGSGRVAKLKTLWKKKSEQ